MPLFIKMMLGKAFKKEQKENANAEPAASAPAVNETAPAEASAPAEDAALPAAENNEEGGSEA